MFFKLFPLQNPLAIALAEGDLEFIARNINNSRYVKHCEVFENELLVQTLAERDYSSAKRLIKNLPNINAQDDNGCTVLMYAVIYKADMSVIEAIIERLIADGLDINIKDNFGLTAFDHAQKNQRGRHITKLLKPYIK